MNTIIATWHTAGKGKSNSLLALANLLRSRYQTTHKVIYSSKDITKLTIDFTLIIEINNKIIAIESQGDPKTGLEKRLQNIVKNYNPNIIFCTCRTKGETVYAVDNIANNFNYDTIWTSTYQVTRNHNLANQIKGEHLLDLILQFGLI